MEGPTGAVAGADAPAASSADLNIQAPSMPGVRTIEQPQMECALPIFDTINTPSRKDNISAEDETDLRIIGCNLIQLAGMCMKQHQVRAPFKPYH